MSHTQENTRKPAWSDLRGDERYAVIAESLYTLLERQRLDLLGRIDLVASTLPDGYKHLAVDVYHDVVNRAALRRLRERR